MAYLDKYDTPLEAGQVKTGQSVLVGHGHKAFLIWDPTISQVRIDVGYRGVLGARTSRNNPCRGKGGERAYKTHNIWQNLGNSAIYIHLPEIHWNSTNESICSFAFPGQMPLLPKDYIVGPCIFVLRVVGPMHAELVPTFGWPKVTRHNHWIELVGIFFMLLDLLMPSKDNVLLQKKLCWNLKPRERISNPDPFPCIWCSNAKHTQSETLAFA